MRRHLAVLALVVAAIALSAGCGNDEPSGQKTTSMTATAEPSDEDDRLISVDGGFRMGPLVIDRSGAGPSTLSDVEKVLGAADSCVGTQGEVTATWSSEGIAGDFATLGGFTAPDGTPDTTGKITGCEARDRVKIDILHFLTSRWVTDEGLRIGDTKARMLALYPAASDHTGERYRPGWWLRGRPNPYVPGQNIPDLTATVLGHEVRSLNVSVQAQGD